MASNRLMITPKNETEWHALRAMDVTSTESAALFEMSPYTTRFELWHRKREQRIETIEARGRMLWGQRMQDTIARGIAEDYGVKVRRINAYMRLSNCRMGASFDFEIVGLADGEHALLQADQTLRALYREHGAGVLEIKNVDSLVFKNEWSAERDEETGAKEYDAPAHIEIQVQHQLRVIERAWSALGVLVGGNNPIVIIRHRDVEVGETIENRIREFWQSVDDNVPPPPVFPDDAAFACKLYGYAEPGKVYDGRQDEALTDMIIDYVDAADRHTKASEDKKIAQAKIFTHIGEHEKALANGFTVSAAMVSPCHVEYDRDGFRGFRVTKLKEAKPTTERKTA